MVRAQQHEIAPVWWQRLEWRPWKLALDPVRAGDAPRVKRALTAEIARWVGFESLDVMRDGTPIWANEADLLARQRLAYRYLVTRDGGFAGTIELRPDATKGHIGYWLRRSHRGRGTITYANHLLIRIAFDGLRLKAVDWAVDAANAASIRVIERLGAEFLSCLETPRRAHRDAEARYRLARRAYAPPDDAPATIEAMLTSV